MSFNAGSAVFFAGPGSIRRKATTQSTQIQVAKAATNRPATEANNYRGLRRKKRLSKKRQK
jgi:hypothetical protein